MACQTEGCPRFGVVIAVDMAPLDLETGLPIPTGPIVCGVCGQQITDISDEPPADEPPIDDTEA